MIGFERCIRIEEGSRQAANLLEGEDVLILVNLE
jgi:hypothetical protein